MIDVSLILEAKAKYLETLRKQAAPADTVAQAQAHLANAVVNAIMYDSQVERSSLNTAAIKALLIDTALGLNPQAPT